MRIYCTDRESAGILRIYFFKERVHTYWEYIIQTEIVRAYLGHSVQIECRHIEDIVYGQRECIHIEDIMYRGRESTNIMNKLCTYKERGDK